MIIVILDYCNALLSGHSQTRFRDCSIGKFGEFSYIGHEIGKFIIVCLSGLMNDKNVIMIFSWRFETSRKGDCYGLKT